MSSDSGHACPNCRQRNLTECRPDCKFRSIPMQGAVVDHHPVEAFATGSTSVAERSGSDLDPQVQSASAAVAAAQPKSGDPAADVPDEPICSERDKDKLVEMLDDAAPIATAVGTPIQEPAAGTPPQSGDLAADVPDAAPAASPVGSPVVPLSLEGSPVEAFGAGSTSVAGGSSSDLDPQVQSASGADAATPPQSGDLAADVPDAAPAACPVGSPVVPLSVEGSPVEAFGTGSTSVTGGSSSDHHSQVQSASAAVAAAQPKSGDPTADVPDEPIYAEVDTEEVMKWLADSAPASPVQETVVASLESGDLAADVPVAAPAASPVGSSSVVPESAASGVAGPSSSAAKNALPESPEYRDDPKLLVWINENQWTYVSASVETVAGGGNNPDAAVVNSNSSDWSGGTGSTDASGSSFSGEGDGNVGGGGGGSSGGGGDGGGGVGGGNGGAPAESQSSS